MSTCTPKKEERNWRELTYRRGIQMNELIKSCLTADYFVENHAYLDLLYTLFKNAVKTSFFKPLDSSI